MKRMMILKEMMDHQWQDKNWNKSLKTQYRICRDYKMKMYKKMIIKSVIKGWIKQWVRHSYIKCSHFKIKNQLHNTLIHINQIQTK